MRQPHCISSRNRSKPVAEAPAPIEYVDNRSILGNNPAILMKVLFYHFTPFSLAHGGQQIQIVRTAQALRNAGGDVDFLNWHDDAQHADILHFFGRIPAPLLHQAHQKRWKVVVADLLAAQGARSTARRSFERFTRRLLERALPPGPRSTLGWTTYKLADACIALTSWEKLLLQEQFETEPSRVHVVPNGVDPVFFGGDDTARAEWLLCVATIAPVKRVLETALAALAARTPIQFVGRPYSESDPYVAEFHQCVRANPQVLRFEGAIEDRSELARRYRQARGLVLLSQWESQSLAALEASASKCPLLLMDLPWARSTFGQNATYVRPGSSPAAEATHLRAFYDQAPQLPIPPRPLTWDEVGAQLAAVYRAILTR